MSAPPKPPELASRTLEGGAAAPPHRKRPSRGAIIVIIIVVLLVICGGAYAIFAVVSGLKSNHKLGKYEQQGAIIAKNSDTSGVVQQAAEEPTKTSCTAAQYRNNGVCTALTVCAANQKQVSAPTETTNRTCRNKCPLTQYYDNGTCKALKTCGAKEEEATAPTMVGNEYMSNRSCRCKSGNFKFQGACVTTRDPLTYGGATYRSFWGKDWFGNTMPGYPKNRNLEQCAADCNARSQDHCASNPNDCKGGGACKGFMVRGSNCWLKNSYWGAPNFSGFCLQNQPDNNTCKSYIHNERHPPKEA